MTEKKPITYRVTSGHTAYSEGFSRYFFEGEQIDMKYATPEEVEDLLTLGIIEVVKEHEVTNGS
jgi:hypothetical protein